MNASFGPYVTYAWCYTCMLLMGRGGEVALCQIAALQVVGNTLQMHICGSGVGVGLVRCYGLVEWWPAAAVAV